MNRVLKIISLRLFFQIDNNIKRRKKRKIFHREKLIKECDYRYLHDNE